MRLIFGCGAALAVLLSLAQDARAQGRRRTLPADKTRGHASVLEAFGDVGERARRSTVRVLADGEPVAWGLVVGDDGSIATKRSEVVRARSLLCELPDGRREPARIVGSDASTDVALLRVEAEGLAPVEWAEASPGVARFVATVGHGELPLAIGVVSLPEYEPPAPRGGGGTRRPARLGVRYRAGEGPAILAAVTRGSAAHRAGLAVGDEILDVDGIPVGSAESLIDTLARLYGGDEIQVAFRRGDREDRARIVLDAAPERRRMNRQERLWGDLSEVRAGFPRVLQHDTVLTPDQCGGAIVTLDGRVAGMNIARVGRVETWALPAALVRDVAERLRAEAEAAPSSGR